MNDMNISNTQSADAAIGFIQAINYESLHLTQDVLSLKIILNHTFDPRSRSRTSIKHLKRITKLNDNV